MRRVVYLMSGPAHLPYLTVSLHTLREHWDGSVMVAAWPESIDVVRQIACDQQLQVHYFSSTPEYRGKNDQFLAKIKLVRSFPAADIILYLDADTTINGDLTPLFVAAEQYGFCATQFNDWTTEKGTIRKRLEDLRAFSAIPRKLVDDSINYLYPSVNGGIWAAQPTSPVLPLWYQYSMEARSTFIADEKVLHLMTTKFSVENRLKVLVGGRWNCSPKYQPTHLEDKDVIIRHFHGDSCVRPDKCQRGYDEWWPKYQECLEQNVGGIKNWIGSIHNKWMEKLT